MTVMKAVDDSVILIDEYNHRLFNTFQVISSTVHRCVRHNSQDDLMAALNDLSVRLGCLTALHKLLAGRPVMALEDHCLAICQLLIRAFGAADVTPEVRMSELWLAPDQELRVSLAVTELVTNVLKHSLTGGLHGTIWVDLRKTLDGAELSASDSLRRPLETQIPPRVLDALARGLGGEAFIADRGGFVAGILFPLDEITAVDLDPSDACPVLVAISPRVPKISPVVQNRGSAIAQYRPLAEASH